MITIQSTQPASLRIYLDDELFIDQTLPWPTTKLTASTEHKVRTVRIENHGQKEVNASVGDRKHLFSIGDYTIQPGQSVDIS